MLKYQVVLSPVAQKDIRDIETYLKEKLISWSYLTIPRAILNKIKSLETVPERFPMYHGYQNTRFAKVKHYLIIYDVEKKQQLVTVLRVLYGRRNLEEIKLRDM